MTSTRPWRRPLVLAAHSDDEVLMAGGTIAPPCTRWAATSIVIAGYRHCSAGFLLPAAFETDFYVALADTDLRANLEALAEIRGGEISRHAAEAFVAIRQIV